MPSERSLWCGTIRGAIKQRTFPIASASKKSLRISPTKKPKNGVAIRVGRPSTNPLRLHHDELRVVILIDCYTVTHDLSFVNILLSLFAVIPETGSCPESLGELACFVGRQVPKNAPTRPIVLWPSTPVQRTLTTPPQPRQYAQQSVQWTAGIRRRFREFSGIAFFLSPKIGSHPPPLTLTVGPPRHSH